MSEPDLSKVRQWCYLFFGTSKDDAMVCHIHISPTKLTEPEAFAIFKDYEPGGSYSGTSGIPIFNEFVEQSLLSFMNTMLAKPDVGMMFKIMLLKAFSFGTGYGHYMASKEFEKKLEGIFGSGGVDLNDVSPPSDSVDDTSQPEPDQTEGPDKTEESVGEADDKPPDGEGKPSGNLN